MSELDFEQERFEKLLTQICTGFETVINKMTDDWKRTIEEAKEYTREQCVK